MRSFFFDALKGDTQGGSNTSFVGTTPCVIIECVLQGVGHHHMYVFCMNLQDEAPTNVEGWMSAMIR
jgi:hypothetical protein